MNDKPNELRKMIVWHVMGRHVQLHNGNLMTEASATLLFDFRTRVYLTISVFNVARRRWKRETLARPWTRTSFSWKGEISITLITNRGNTFVLEKTIYATATIGKGVGYEWFILILCKSNTDTKRLLSDGQNERDDYRRLDKAAEIKLHRSRTHSREILLPRLCRELLTLSNSTRLLSMIRYRRSNSRRLIKKTLLFHD